MRSWPWSPLSGPKTNEFQDNRSALWPLGVIFLHPLERSGVLTALIKRNRRGIWQWADPALIGGGVLLLEWNGQSLRAEATALDVWHGGWHFQWHFLHLYFPPKMSRTGDINFFYGGLELMEVAPLEGWICNWIEIKIKKRLPCHSNLVTFFLPVNTKGDFLTNVHTALYHSTKGDSYQGLSCSKKDKKHHKTTRNVSLCTIFQVFWMENNTFELLF